MKQAAPPKTLHNSTRLALRYEHGAKTSLPGSSTEHNLQIATMAKRGLALPLINLPKAAAEARSNEAYERALAPASLKKLGKLFPEEAWRGSFEEKGWVQMRSGLNAEELNLIKVIERVQLAEMGINPLDASTHHHCWASAAYDQSECRSPYASCCSLLMYTRVLSLHAGGFHTSCCSLLTCARSSASRRLGVDTHPFSRARLLFYPPAAIRNVGRTDSATDDHGRIR